MSCSRCLQGKTAVFNDPRRFGFMRIIPGSLASSDWTAPRAKAAGIKIDVEPHDTEWKSRAFEVTEASGFKITISSHV